MRGVNHMTQAEFATLRDKTRLKDSILAFFLKSFVHEKVKGVNYFSSGLFNLIKHSNRRVYDYEESVEAFVRNQYSIGMRTALHHSNNW